MAKPVGRRQLSHDDVLRLRQEISFTQPVERNVYTPISMELFRKTYPPLAERGLTQREIAARLGTSQGTISRMKRRMEAADATIAAAANATSTTGENGNGS